MSEAKLSKYIYNKAKELGCLVVKIDASHKGWPDRLIIKNGKVMFIEVKSPNGKGRLSKMQEHIIFLLRCEQIETHVISDYATADFILSAFAI